MTNISQSANIPRRPLVRKSVWLFCAAVVLLGLAATAAARLLPVPDDDTALGQYKASARPIVEDHNTLAGRWNAFVPEFNAITEGDQQSSLAVYAEGSKLSTELAADSQSVLSKWRKLIPPLSAQASHAMALKALELTQDGYIAFQDYFELAVKFGTGDATMAVAGNDKLREAAALWLQAQELAAAR